MPEISDRVKPLNWNLPKAIFEGRRQRYQSVIGGMVPPFISTTHSGPKALFFSGEGYLYVP